MTEDEFWGHINTSHNADPDTHAGQLAERLAKLPEGEILDFVHRWDSATCRAHRRDLWGAAYLINGGSSDDGFHYFCEWLILQGRTVYESAITDPDTLAEVLDGEGDIEYECCPGTDAWFAATGSNKDDGGYDAFARAMRFRHRQPPQSPELAPPWDFDVHGEMHRRLPRLAAIYLPPDAENDP